MEEAWLLLLQSHSELVTREVTCHSEEGGHKYIYIPSRWDRLVAEFHGIFGPPGMPVDRDTVYHSELLPNAEPYCRH